MIFCANHIYKLWMLFLTLLNKKTTYFIVSSLIRNYQSPINRTTNISQPSVFGQTGDVSFRLPCCRSHVNTLDNDLLLQQSSRVFFSNNMHWRTNADGNGECVSRAEIWHMSFLWWCHRFIIIIVNVTGNDKSRK